MVSGMLIGKNAKVSSHFAMLILTIGRLKIRALGVGLASGKPRISPLTRIDGNGSAPSHPARSAACTAAVQLPVYRSPGRICFQPPVMRACCAQSWPGPIPMAWSGAGSPRACLAPHSHPGEWVRGHAAMQPCGSGFEAMQPCGSGFEAMQPCSHAGGPRDPQHLAIDVPGSALKLLLLRGLFTPLGVVITRGEGCDQRLPW